MKKTNPRCGRNEESDLNTNQIFFDGSYANRESVILPLLLADVRNRMISIQYSEEKVQSLKKNSAFRIRSEHDLTLAKRIEIALENELMS